MGEQIEKVSNISEDFDSSKRVTVDIRNKVEVVGVIISEISEHMTQHTSEKLSEFDISIPRVNSQATDVIHIVVPERSGYDVSYLKVGDQVRVKGQVRSSNQNVDGKNRHMTIIFTDYVEMDLSTYKVNDVRLRGYICKEPKFRTTPTGRNICDLFIAVNRNYKRCDYIPCIAWGRDAKFASQLQMGDGVFIEGRIQSRAYRKKINEDSYEERTAYEVSISTIRQVSDDEKITETYFIDEN